MKGVFQFEYLVNSYSLPFSLKKTEKMIFRIIKNHLF